MVITLSGYLDPVRGELRDAALSLGGLSGLSRALHACPFCYAHRVARGLSGLSGALHAYPAGVARASPRKHARTPATQQTSPHACTDLLVESPAPAACRRDFCDAVTHVCSAFDNTPKTKDARQAGRQVYVVNGEWLRECKRTRRRAPEADFEFGAPAPPPPLPPTAPAPPAVPPKAPRGGRGGGGDGNAARDASPARKRARADSGDRSSGGDGGSSATRKISRHEPTAVKVKEEPATIRSARIVMAANDIRAGKAAGEAGDGHRSPSPCAAATDSATSPAVVITKVTRVDDPVASLDLTQDGDADTVQGADPLIA